MDTHSQSETFSTLLETWIAATDPNPAAIIRQDNHFPDKFFKYINSYDDLTVFIGFLADFKDTAYYEYELFESRELLDAMANTIEDRSIIEFMEGRVGKLSDYGKLAVVLLFAFEGHL